MTERPELAKVDEADQKSSEFGGDDLPEATGCFDSDGLSLEKSEAHLHASAGDPSWDEVSRLKAQFLASLNHEIRTPLSGIFGMTDLLLETGLNEEQREYVVATRMCADSLLRLLNATLDYSALMAGGIRIDEAEFNLEETIEAAIAEHIGQAKSKGLRVFRTFSENLPETVAGDAARFRKLLSQLVENAIKFTVEGHVEVRVESRVTGDHAMLLRIDVVDTGIGIASEQVHQIFEAFRQVESGLTRTKSGLGLGLSIALKLASLMGGRISVSSELGRGSRFSVELAMRIPVEARR